MATPEEIRKNKEELAKSREAGGIVGPYEEISFDKAGNPMPKKSATTTPKKLIKKTKETIDNKEMEDMMKKDIEEEAKNRGNRQNQPISFEITAPKK